MAKVLITEDYLSDIGDAIRGKLGGSTQYTPGQMASAISSIPTVAPTLISKSIVANGTYNASSDEADGYSEVTVNVPNSYAAGDEGKVVSSGALVAQTTRSSNITENGTYDTTLNNSITVAVSGGGSSGISAGTATPSDSDGNDGDIYVKYADIPKLDYVRTSGDQHVNTGYVHKSNTKIVVDCEIESNTQRMYEAIFGARNWGSGTQSFLLFTRFGGNDKVCIARSGSETQGNDFIYDSRIIITMENATASWVSYDGQSSGSVTAGTYNANDGQCPLFIFDINKSSSGGLEPDNSRCVAKLYGFKIFEGNNLIKDFVPSKDGNNIPLLVDLVSGIKHYSATNTALIAGNEVQGESYRVLEKVYIKNNGTWK